jgi:hypothetical protein
LKGASSRASKKPWQASHKQQVSIQKNKEKDWVLADLMVEPRRNHVLDTAFTIRFTL